MSAQGVGEGQADMVAVLRAELGGCRQAWTARSWRVVHTLCRLAGARLLLRLRPLDPRPQRLAHLQAARGGGLHPLHGAILRAGGVHQPAAHLCRPHPGPPGPAAHDSVQVWWRGGWVHGALRARGRERPPCVGLHVLVGLAAGCGLSSAKATSGWQAQPSLYIDFAPADCTATARST